jgi:hypothetical protein
MTGLLSPVEPVVTIKQLIDLRNEAGKVYVDPSDAVRGQPGHGNAQPGKFGINDIAKYIM